MILVDSFTDANNQVVKIGDTVNRRIIGPTESQDFYMGKVNRIEKSGPLVSVATDGGIFPAKELVRLIP